MNKRCDPCRRPYQTRKDYYCHVCVVTAAAEAYYKHERSQTYHRNDIRPPFPQYSF